MSKKLFSVTWDDPEEMARAPAAQDILHVCLGIASMLIEKNKAYGDSALKPVRVFSKADAVEQIKVRMDDKLSRIMRGEAAGEDAILDFVGYYVLLRVAELRSPQETEKIASQITGPLDEYYCQNCQWGLTTCRRAVMGCCKFCTHHSR